MEQKIITSFSELGLVPPLCEATDLLGWKKPSDIQREAIPYGLKRRDLIALAETGSGKTGAFLLPILQALLESGQKLFALVLAPTRELAFQISEQVLGRLLSPVTQHSATFGILFVSDFSFFQIPCSTLLSFILTLSFRSLSPLTCLSCSLSLSLSLIHVCRSSSLHVMYYLTMHRWTGSGRGLASSARPSLVAST